MVPRLASRVTGREQTAYESISTSSTSPPEDDNGMAVEPQEERWPTVLCFQYCRRAQGGGVCGGVTVVVVGDIGGGGGSGRRLVKLCKEVCRSRWAAKTGSRQERVISSGRPQIA